MSNWMPGALACSRNEAVNVHGPVVDVKRIGFAAGPWRWWRSWCAAALLVGAAAHAAGKVATGTLTVHDVTSLQQALNRARSDKHIHRIELAGGRYDLGAPIQIDETLSGTGDTPFVMTSAPGATAELSGAVPLPALNWRLWKNGIWRAPLAHRTFQRLWLGRRLLVRARYPNFDPHATWGGVAADATSPRRVMRWHDPAGGILHALQGNGWGSVEVPILGKSTDGSLIFGPQVGNNRAMPPSANVRFVENILEELDATDEWYFDERKGLLYYKPEGAHPPPARGFRAGATDELLNIRGVRGEVHDLRIEHLKLADTEPSFLKATEPLLRSDWKFARVAAVDIEQARDVQVLDSEFVNLGGHGIVVNGRAERVRIARNHIHDIGGTAIAFVGRPDAVRSPLFEYHQHLAVADIDPVPGPRNDDYPKDSEADDNLIHDIGQVDLQSAGVEISMAARIDVDHNTLYRLPRAAINIGDGTWGGDRITYNDAFDTVMQTGDHGAFNSWGRDRWWDSDRRKLERRVATDRWLVSLDAMAPTVIRRNRLRCDRGWDIDLDDGSSNYIIEQNLLLSGGIKLREGFRRIVRNNILANGTLHPHVWFKDSGDVFEANIVMTDYQPIDLQGWGTRVDHNAFTRRADLLQAQARGTDGHSVAGNPQFQDPAGGDFRVMNHTLAESIGFWNFPMNDFGVRPARLRALAEHPRFDQPRAFQAPPPRAAVYARDGMRFSSIRTRDEQSVAGLASVAGVRVLEVSRGGAAEEAGIRPGDVIVGVAREADGNAGSLARAKDFAALLDSLRPGAAIDLVGIRDQANFKIHLHPR